jgi:hypothetical protein
MSGFKLGITIPARDMTPFMNQNNIKPIKKSEPEPDIFYTVIDNRQEILERIKRDIDYQLEMRMKTLPTRY